jgi:hypothetical protein
MRNVRAFRPARFVGAYPWREVIQGQRLAAIKSGEMAPLIMEDFETRPVRACSRLELTETVGRGRNTCLPRVTIYTVCTVPNDANHGRKAMIRITMTVQST